MSYENATLARNDTATVGQAGERRAQKPFPFEARARHLAEEFMRPGLRDLAKAEDMTVAGLDPIGWAICRFMFEIATYQARRRARCEMLKTESPEAPWIYRDLYQLDRSDLMRRVHVMVPQDAMMHADPNGHRWFLAWQDALANFIGRDRMLGRRPDHAVTFGVITPGEAYAQLVEAWQGAVPAPSLALL
jgi:hypothetical protein